MKRFRWSIPLLRFCAAVSIWCSSLPLCLGQKLLCTAKIDGQSPPTVRAAGATELIGDLLLTCQQNPPNSLSRAYLETDVTVFFNTNVTSRILGPGTQGLQSEIVMVVNENYGKPALGSVLGGSDPNQPLPQYGEYVGQIVNKVVVPKAKLPVPGVVGPNGRRFPSPLLLRFRNVRVNASAIGSSQSDIPSQVFLFSTVNAADNLIDLAEPQQSVGLVEDKLIQAYLQHPNGSAALACKLSDASRVDTPFALLTIQEPTPNHLRPAGPGRTESGIISDETGFPLDDFRGGLAQATSGTRVRLQFSDVPARVTLALPKKFVNGSFAMQMITTDERGAGPYQPVPGEDLQIVGPNSESRIAVTYEVTAADPARVDTITMPIFLRGGSNPGLGTIGLSVSLAPVASDSSSGNASASFPIPRFVSNSRNLTLGTISPCRSTIEAVSSRNLLITDQPTVVTIDGFGFDPDSVVYLVGVGLLKTEYVSPTRLRFQIDQSSFNPRDLQVQTPVVVVNPKDVKSGLDANPFAPQFFAENRIVMMNLLVSTAPNPVVASGGLVDPASVRTTLAPGGLLSIFGSELANATASANSLPLPTKLAGTRVRVNGKEAAILYASPRQVNVQVPTELVPYTSVYFSVIIGDELLLFSYHSIEIEREGKLPFIVIFPSAYPQSGGIFTVDQSGKGQGVVVNNRTGRIADQNSPARAGDVLVLYASGLGPTKPEVAIGQPASLKELSPTVDPIGATIGGVSAEVLFAGLAPGFVGLYQVNLRMPRNVPSGSALPLVLFQKGQRLPMVTIAVE